MPYTSCYQPRILNCIGGVLISADGSRRTIPDHYLYCAKLQNDSTLLRLYYSSCTVDISGYHLKSIYDDVVIGKLGTVSVSNPADAEPKTARIIPHITGIIYINMPPGAAFDMESRDA